MSTYECPVKIDFYTKIQLKSFLKESIENNNVVLILNLSAAKRYQLDTFIDSLNLTKQFIWINSIDSNPNQISILNALKKINNMKIDLIITIGGGSAIDLAKAIKAFYNSKIDFNEKIITLHLEEKKYFENKFKIIGIPTTSGTGSELTQWATIWDTNKVLKYSIDDANILPDRAIIVPELTLSMNKELTLSTGLDSISQAIEAYWSKKTNPKVQEIAIRAISIFRDYLKPCLENLNDLNIREMLSLGSVLTGMAFSQTRTTACHAISYPLTMYFNVPHGFAVALTLAKISEINRGYFINDDSLYDLFKEYGSLNEWLDFVSKGVVKLKLRTFGIKETDLDFIVEKSFTKGRLDNNPFDLNKNDIKRILKEIL